MNDEPTIVFNNTEFTLDPQLRKQEMNAISERLAKLGIRTLAKGQAGEKLQNSDEAYTTTLLFDCGKDRLHVVDAIQDEEMYKTLAVIRELRNQEAKAKP